MARRVLLTGGSGFIGRSLISALVAAGGWDIHAVASTLPEEPRERVHWHRADLRSAPAVSELCSQVEADHLVHLAWCSGPGFYDAPDNELWVAASMHLLEQFQEHGGERAVLAGTCAEYDWSAGFCAEGTTPLFPSTPYGAAKKELSERALAYADAHDLSAAWARIFFVYGPGDQPRRLVPTVVQSLLRGEPARCSHGRQVRDYLYVKDVASAFAALVEGDLTGAVNVASGHPHRIRDMVLAAARAIGREDLVRLGALPTPEREAPLVLGDVRRLEGELGFRPGYSLDRGLAETIAWYQHAGHAEHPQADPH